MALRPFYNQARDRGSFFTPIKRGSKNVCFQASRKFVFFSAVIPYGDVTAPRGKGFHRRRGKGGISRVDFFPWIQLQQTRFSRIPWPPEATEKYQCSLLSKKAKLWFRADCFCFLKAFKVKQERSPNFCFIGADQVKFFRRIFLAERDES